MMSKFGGGTSGYFGNLRHRGAPITDNGESSGAVLAEVFAWIGVAMAHVTFITMSIFGFIANSRQDVEISEEELAELFDDIWKDGDK